MVCGGTSMPLLMLEWISRRIRIRQRADEQLKSRLKDLEIRKKHSLLYFIFRFEEYIISDVFYLFYLTLRVYFLRKDFLLFNVDFLNLFFVVVATFRRCAISLFLAFLNKCVGR